MACERVTKGSTSNDQLLYFTSSSLLDDGTHVVLISDRSGSPNLYGHSLRDGTSIKLSNNHDGYLKSYVYFDGTPYAGLGKASVSMHAATGSVYYIQGRSIVHATLAGTRRTLAELPLGQMTAFTHVSADGCLLCVPTTDAHALDDDVQLAGRPEYDIDLRVQRLGLSSYLRIYDTASGALLANERVPNAWVTHVQFNPVNRNQILYNHEWPSHCGIRRMWLFDGSSHLRLRTEGQGRSKEDWTCHEMWERDGSAIIYHGEYANRRAYVGRVSPDGRDVTEIAMPAEYKRYGHFTVGRPGELACDGYYAEPDDPAGFGGAWITLVKADWSTGRLQWHPLCRHGSSWATQDEHPHPIFDPSCKYIYFTSDFEGQRAVYRVATPGDA